MACTLDVTLHGAFATLGEVADAAEASGERHIVYLARSTIWRGSAAPSTDRRSATPMSPSWRWRGSPMSGSPRPPTFTAASFTTAGSVLRPRGAGPAPITEFWFGTIAQRRDAPRPGQRHERRLADLERLLIGWFVPPLNRQGIRTEAGDGGPERTGGAPTAAIEATIAVRGTKGRKRHRKIEGFPERIGFDQAAWEFDATWGRRRLGDPRAAAVAKACCCASTAAL